jgi:hypothetical protein
MVARPRADVVDGPGRKTVKITRVEAFHVDWGRRGEPHAARQRLARDRRDRLRADVVFRTPVRPVRGKFVLADTPGLGLELDESELRKRMIPGTSTAGATT